MFAACRCVEPTAPHEIWAMDFLSDRLLHGRRFRAHTARRMQPLCVLSCCPLLVSERCRRGTLEEWPLEHGYPKCLRVDNGPEFIASAPGTLGRRSRSRAAVHSSPESQLRTPSSSRSTLAFETNFSIPIAFERSLTSTTRAEEWRVEYNTTHPHAGLGGKTPEEFLALYETSPTPQISLAS